MYKTQARGRGENQDTLQSPQSDHTTIGHTVTLHDAPAAAVGVASAAGTRWPLGDAREGASVQSGLYFRAVSQAVAAGHPHRLR